MNLSLFIDKGVFINFHRKLFYTELYSFRCKTNIFFVVTFFIINVFIVLKNTRADIPILLKWRPTPRN